MIIGVESDKAVAAGLAIIDRAFEVAGVQHLTAREFCRLYHTDIARLAYPSVKGRGQLYAIPDEQFMVNVITFGMFCWNPLRERYGEPLFLRNGYRPRDYNAAVKGARRSKHLVAAAGNIYPIGSSPSKARRLRDVAIDVVLDNPNDEQHYGLGLYAGNVHLDYGVRTTQAVWGSRAKEFGAERDERNCVLDLDPSEYWKGGVA